MLPFYERALCMKYSTFDHRRGVPVAIIAILIVVSAALLKYLGA